MRRWLPDLIVYAVLLAVAAFGLVMVLARPK